MADAEFEVIDREVIEDTAMIIGGCSAARSVLDASLKLKNPVFLYNINGRSFAVIERDKFEELKKKEARN